MKRAVRNEKEWEMGFNVRPCEYTWKELSKAAEGLDPNKQPLRRKRRLSVEDGFDVRGAQNLLIETSMLEVYKEKFTEEDFKIFERLLKKARQDLDLHKDYLSNTKIIKYYSSVERVKEKIPQFDLILDWDVETLVQEAIWSAKYWYMTDLYYQYALFLPTCELVQNNTLTPRTLQLAGGPMFIKNKFKTEDATFTRKGFHFLPLLKIVNGLRGYFKSVPSSSFAGKDKVIDNYMKCISVERKLEKEQYRKRMKALPFGFNTPFHFLVCKERDEGCPIQEPLLELTKIRAYFGGFVRMPTVIDRIRFGGPTYHIAMSRKLRLEEGGEVEFVEPEEAESEEEEPVESENEDGGN